MRNDIKKFIFALFVFTLVILSGFMIKAYLNKTTQVLLKDIDKVEANITNNEWEKAYINVVELNKTWEKTENIWTIFTNHHEIDSISVTMKTSLEYIREREKSDSLANLSSLKHFISHIPDMERIVIKNIF
jgi:DUF1680 family protein